MCDYCAWIEKLLRPPRLEALPTICKNIAEKPETPVKYDRTILVHGNANSIFSREEINGILERIERAATEAYRELAKGCDSVDAVELAISRLENEETCKDLEENVVTRKDGDRSAIRDAAIMDSDSNAGCVGAVTGVVHPITLAKNVMQKTDHVLIVERGARKLESEIENSEEVCGSNEDCFQAEQLDVRQPGNESETWQKCTRLYGAIARDRKGRLACGVSTIDNRRESVARSSMSAAGTVLGCGIFADEESCCTVSGEDRAIYVYAPARKIIKRLKRDRATASNRDETVRVEKVLNDELTNFFKDTGESCIGAAAMSVQGQPEVAFKSHYFPWAFCNNGVVTYGCIHDEVFTKDVDGLDMPLDCECR